MNDRTGQKVPQSARSKSSSGSNESSPMKGFKFDPMKNTHLWTMWRIGNTEKIVNFTKHKSEESNRQNGSDYGIFSGTPYGSPTLLVPPLAHNISVTGTTRIKAAEMMSVVTNDEPSDLKTGQFIYFGLPRVTLKNNKPDFTPR